MNTTNQQTTDYRTTDYRTQGPQTTDHSQPNKHPYALRRDGGCWQLTFEGRQSTFTHELGALYAAYLLLHPRQAVHGVALALKAREKFVGQAFQSAGSWGFPAPPAGLGDSKVVGTGRLESLPYAAEALQQRIMGLEDASSVRTLWRRQRELERVLEDRLEMEPVKAEALRELEELTERLRQSPWLSCHGAERCAHAVGEAIRRFHARLVAAVDAQEKPDPVLRAFAVHLHEYLLVPSGRGGSDDREQAEAPPGCFIYAPPKGVVWSDGQGAGSAGRVPAAVDYLARFLCAGFAVALLVTGCAVPRPLKGGRALTTRAPAGGIEQTLVQGENPAQASKQDQETVRVRTYTVPAGSRMEQSQVWEGERPREPKLLRTTAEVRARKDARPPGRQPPSTLNPQPSTALVMSAPMPVVEREETRARTELGAAQKDTAREIGAKLSSLKGIVWVGVGLFVFGLGSLVYPPLKVIVGSVTTSAALMLGGVALMVLPSMIVGNELLILGIVGLAVGGWFLAHRHGQLRGQVAASTGGQTPGSNQSSVTSNQSSVASGEGQGASGLSSVVSGQ
jgi:hypothetical protein